MNARRTRGPLLLLLAAVTSAMAQAQSTSWPSRPVRIVVGFSAGSASDISARMLAPRLAELWGQGVVVENRPGAGSTLASLMVAKATPDGYTIMLISTAFAINAVLQSNPPYDPLRDFHSVTQIGYTTGVFAVAPSLGVKSVKELIALAQERPGKLLFGSSGAGSGIHITAERFRFTTGIKTVHIGFKGQPEMLIEIMAGRVHYGFPSMGPVVHLVKDGRILALAVLAPRRVAWLPEVPTLYEVLPGFERDASQALMVPAGTPRAVIDKIAKDVARVLDTSDVKKQMDAISFAPAPTTPAEYDQILRKQLTTFERVARQAGLK